MDSSPDIGLPVGSRLPRYTWEDFVAVGDDDRREFIDGDLIEVDVPNKRHEHAVGGILFRLRAWLHTQPGGGLVLPSDYKIRVSKYRGVMPDVQYFGPANPGSETLDDDDDARPDLTVEVIAPSSREYDQTTKLEWYAEIGVPEYWLVDPEAHALQRFQLRDGRYTISAALRGDALFKPDTFQGLELPLAELWSIGGSSRRVK
jgi:Uma2 family endonuclease